MEARLQMQRNLLDELAAALGRTGSTFAEGQRAATLGLTKRTDGELPMDEQVGY